MRAIDVSVYSGEIPVEKWRAVKADGYDLAIIGLFHGRTANRYAAQQMRAAHEAGMLLAGYVLIAPWTGMTGGWQVDAGLEVAAPELIPQLRFLPVDMEVDGITEAMAAGAVTRVEAGEGLRPLIYTGRWWWVYHFGDSQAFKDIPLWTAQYPFFMPDEPENLLEWVKLYGGWTRDKLVGWQYTNTTQFHGINCCKDWFDDAWIRGEEEPMEIQDDFVGLRAEEMSFMQAAENAHQLTRMLHMQTLAAIRHSKHESPEAEMRRWKAYSAACNGEIATIREAQERCRVHGRPGSLPR